MRYGHYFCQNLFSVIYDKYIWFYLMSEGDCSGNNFEAMTRV